MQYLTEIYSYQSEKKSAVTLGKFDGLHRGHQKLIQKIGEYASECVQGIVCAFDMGRDSLLTNEERRKHLEGKADVFVECPFTKEIREMSAEDFIEKILIGIFHAEYVVVGTDFRFGYEKKGDVHMLAEYAPKYGYHLDIIEKEKYNGREISSTYVKEALSSGDVALANRLLGYAYGMSGVVEHGKHLGRTLGFPTMNVPWNEKKIAPRFGVYACNINIDGCVYHGIGNVGVKPTVTEEDRLLTEVFVFGYEGNAYGREIEIEFCEFERPETKFADVKALKEQVNADILYGKKYFTTQE